MTRQEANLEICNKLIKFFKEHKNVRFNQALFNLNITEFSEETINHIKKGTHTFISTLKDKYGEESVTTLNNIK